MKRRLHTAEQIVQKLREADAKVAGGATVGQGLGISVGVGFGVEAMDHTMEFYSVGCDFVNRPVVAPPAP